jgi:predicted nuclease with TOPRIM domain
VPQSKPEIVSKLADRGEEALQKLAGSQAAQKLLDTLSMLRARIDEQQKRLSGVEALEKRVAELEKRLKALERESKPARRPAARKPAAKKPSGSK